MQNHNHSNQVNSAPALISPDWWSAIVDELQRPLGITKSLRPECDLVIAAYTEQLCGRPLDPDYSYPLQLDEAIIADNGKCLQLSVELLAADHYSGSDIPDWHPVLTVGLE